MGNQDIDFQGFRVLRLRHFRKRGQHYYIVGYYLTCRLNTDRNIHELEWLNDHFTLNLYYYELALTVFYLFTAESVYIHVTSGDVGSEVGEHDPQNIWNPQKKKTADLSQRVHHWYINK